MHSGGGQPVPFHSIRGTGPGGFHGEMAGRDAGENKVPVDWRIALPPDFGTLRHLLVYPGTPTGPHAGFPGGWHTDSPAFGHRRMGERYSREKQGGSGGDPPQLPRVLSLVWEEV